MPQPVSVFKLPAPSFMRRLAICVVALLGLLWMLLAFVFRILRPVLVFLCVGPVAVLLGLALGVLSIAVSIFGALMAILAISALFAGAPLGMFLSALGLCAAMLVQSVIHGLFGDTPTEKHLAGTRLKSEDDIINKANHLR